MWVWALLTFIAILGLGLICAQLNPTSKGWTLAEYVWVSIATLAIFTATQDARSEGQAFERETRIRDIELYRYIASHFAESQISMYRQRLQEKDIQDPERQTWQLGVQWFESALRAISEVHDSKSWQEYLPTAGKFKHPIVADPGINHADWLAQDQRNFSSFVSRIEAGFDSLEELEPDISSKNRHALLVSCSPFLLAIAGALELAAVRAKSVAEHRQREPIPGKVD